MVGISSNKIWVCQRQWTSNDQKRMRMNNHQHFISADMNCHEKNLPDKILANKYVTSHKESALVTMQLHCTSILLCYASPSWWELGHMAHVLYCPNAYQFYTCDEGKLTRHYLKCHAKYNLQLGTPKGMPWPNPYSSPWRCYPLVFVVMQWHA